MLVTVVETYFITFKTEETNGKYNFSLDIKLYNNKECLQVFKALIKQNKRKQLILGFVELNQPLFTPIFWRLGNIFSSCSLHALILPIWNQNQKFCPNNIHVTTLRQVDFGKHDNFTPL